jgi:hypothetical protein
MTQSPRTAHLWPATLALHSCSTCPYTRTHHTLYTNYDPRRYLHYASSTASPPVEGRATWRSYVRVGLRPPQPPADPLGLQEAVDNGLHRLLAAAVALQEGNVPAHTGPITSVRHSTLPPGDSCTHGMRTLPPTHTAALGARQESLTNLSTS